MPTITLVREMPDADLDMVWSVARRIVDYSRFMDQVLSVTEEQVDGVDYATSWVVLFNGNELRWIESDHFDDANKTIKFEQIEGDLASWSGQFHAEASASSVIAQYSITFDLGIPALAELLHPLGERAIRENCAQMLEEIERRSAAVAT
jgi:Polyketide cyclase / dehydrase and lipid transport